MESAQFYEIRKVCPSRALADWAVERRQLARSPWIAPNPRSGWQVKANSDGAFHRSALLSTLPQLKMPI